MSSNGDVSASPTSTHSGVSPASADSTDATLATDATVSGDSTEQTGGGPAPRRGGRARRAVMRPRRGMVKVHRWLAIGLMAWLVVIGLTGAWLVESNQFDAWLRPELFETSTGDVGPDAAVAAAEQELPNGATVYGTALPRNGRGVYQVGAEVETPSPVKEGEPTYEYYTAFVDPGSGEVNGVRDEAGGFTQWLYRGHMYLWQDQGVFGVFDPDSGWCRVDGSGNEPGGVKGVVCDVIPGGEDMVAWFAVGWLVVLVGGFYLWYWPGVKRWANALRVQRGRGRFAFHMSVHKVIGLVFFVPLTVVAFTGIAFAFPNMKAWYQNVTPAQRDFELWIAPEAGNQSEKPQGRDPIGYDEFLSTLEQQYPERTVQYVMSPYGGEKRGVYSAWLTRGFDPWTREGGAGNVWVSVDQYTGEVLADETPEAGNVFDQAWDDWSFPLHTGDFGGPITRVLWVLVGLAPLVLGFTGIAMYLIRRSKRARRNGRLGTTGETSDIDPPGIVASPDADDSSSRSEHHAPVG